MKKIFLLIAALLFTAVNTYADEPDEYKLQIEEMKENFFAQYNNEEYASRADAVRLLTNVYDIKVQYDYGWDKDYVNKIFNDVKIKDNDDIYPDTKDYNAVYNGLKTEIIRGNGKGEFKPDDLITKEDMYVMLYNVIVSDKIKIYEYSDTKGDIALLNNFIYGNDISEYAKIPVSFLIKTGVITDSIDSKGNVTNRELLDVKNKVYNVFKRKNSENYITRIEALEGLNDYSYSGTKEYLSAADYTNYSPFADMCSIVLYSERGAVSFGINNKIISGCADGTFDPQGFITREDMCVMFYNLITSDTINVFEAEPEKYNASDIERYEDNKNVSEYARIPVMFFISNGIISENDGKINPNEYVTKYEYENMKENIKEKFYINRA